MLVLAFDTATDVVSVAIGRDGQPLGMLQLESGREHAERLVPAIASLVADTGVALDQLAAVAVGVGPGRFTGLRVGVTTAKVMAQALRVPVVGIGTLDLVAYPLRHTRRDVVAVVDARRREVFWARYRTVPGGLERVGAEAVDPPHELIAEIEATGVDVLVAGDGADRYRAELAAVDRVALAGPEFSAPSALALLELAQGRLEREEFTSPQALAPVYLRDSDAAINWERAQLRSPA
ncbi:MAG: tRNA (adenosine(37)-N6)-threonylcarbamoyltransferase complex dimerization subunit type 1 TsaB [Actinobacteria bacterium]|nr:tRNA (adenosine(37)-N6)-threonylcarbamoyltransferase complex dimerization subunit type 1 TsaB [Actinomycetota bacterium]